MNGRVVATVVIAAVLGCIIPDRGITFPGGPVNPGAVRIAQRPPTDPQMNDICNVEGRTPSREELTFCPPVPWSRPGGLVRTNEPLCVCPPSQRDARAIPPFSIFAEDPDIDSDDNPLDTLYGVLLLDPDPGSDDPQASVAYINYFGNCQAGTHIPIETDAYGPEVDRAAVPKTRDPTALWEFLVDDLSGRGVDLCNNDNGAKVAPGLHTLRFLVTDREFFRPERPDGAGYGPAQCGVPDLAAGATYAVIEYVFECLDAAASPESCACVEAG